jgi:FAD/FMN-containing dehydrogenase
MPSITTSLSSFNQYPKQACTLHRPEKYAELFYTDKPTIARGKGMSYGDAALNQDGHVVITERLNRLTAWDEKQGLLTAEAGITLAEILEFIVPRGWFLPVTPGTSQVTLGGCIATDVHGKNHHRVGSFGQHIVSFELIQANGSLIQCSAQQNPDTFWATVGGMGLTGIIGTACLKLSPISSPYLQARYATTQNLAETLAYLKQAEKDDDYSVAWIDVLASKNKGRGIVMTAHHASKEELPQALQNKLCLPTTKHITLPFNCPSWFLNKTVMHVFNAFYYYRNSKKITPFFLSYNDYFYPLDKINYWSRLYGAKGFIQYQCVLPTAQAVVGFAELLACLEKANFSAFLGVLKRFGQASSGHLSFPIEGFTLAIDLPLRDPKLFAVLDEMDVIVTHYGGRIYLAKDTRLSSKQFHCMYPRYREWLKIKKYIDPENKFSSSLARRLGL